MFFDWEAYFVFETGGRGKAACKDYVNCLPCYDRSTLIPEDYILHCLEGVAELRFAFLFGSRANGGGARPDSDWDVAVYLAESLDARQRFEIRLCLATELSDLGKADVVVLNEAPPLLAHRAIQGQLLLVRDRRALVRFTVRTLALAGDQRHWSRIHASARQRRLQEGRFGRPGRL